MIRPAIGFLAAVAITTTMDATGYSAFSALPLFPLMVLFWYWERFSGRQIGFRWGNADTYSWALLYPLTVVGAAAAVAWFAGATDWSQTDWNKTVLNLLLIGLTTVLVAIITEEGFFRGWLWTSLNRAGFGDTGVLWLSSLAFALWHVSAVSLDTGFDLPPVQIPVYLVNVLLLGLVWGMLRAISDSIIVASLSHGVWNGLVYTLFGFGTHSGALGIPQPQIYGPEVGYLGILLNAIFALLLWRRWRQRHLGAAGDPPERAP